MRSRMVSGHRSSAVLAPRRLLGSLAFGVTLLVAAVACLGEAGARGARNKAPDSGVKSSPDRPANPQDLQIVDCLLPGQMRRLGRQQTYVTQRRPARTTALDCTIRGGEYIAYDRANYETALRVWLDAAQGGDSQAQYYVGEIYERGLGTKPDYEKAAEWYRKAAEKGQSQAQINLGFLYERGLGVPLDARQALEWYRKAAGVSGVIMLDSEVAAIRQELSEANERLKKAEGESETLARDLETARKELESERSAGRKTGELERRLATLEQQLGTRRQQVEKLRQSQKSYNVAGPSIEIIDTSATRSLSPVQRPRDRELVGRVEAPAGLAKLLVDEKQVSVEDNGFFRVHPGSDRRMTFVAIDLQGKQGRLVYDIDAPPGTGAAGAEGRERPSRTSVKFGSYHALVIGNSEYASLPHLGTATGDAKDLANLLRDRYGFRVTLLLNASYLDMLSAFGKLREDLSEKDNLLIYYAGHGELDPASGLGYWLPVDAEKDRKTNWMSSREISLQLSLLPPKHVLLVADSCYSGALSRSSLARLQGATEQERDGWMREAAAKRSRTVLTSGGLKPVLDTGGGGHSIFTGALLDTLSRSSGVVETYKLWSAVKARVMLETRSLPQEQVPEYAPIQYAGHESGEFFFVPARG